MNVSEQPPPPPTHSHEDLYLSGGGPFVLLSSGRPFNLFAVKLAVRVSLSPIELSQVQLVDRGGFHWKVTDSTHSTQWRKVGPGDGFPEDDDQSHRVVQLKDCQAGFIEWEEQFRGTQMGWGNILLNWP